MIPYLFNLPGVKNRDLSTGLPRAGASVELQSASFDLQKVLNTPHGNNMLLFYSRKYAVYNLCFYESITRNGFCFI